MEEELQQALEWLKHLYIGDENDICALIVPAMETLIKVNLYEPWDHIGEEVLQRFLDLWKSSTIVGDAKA